ncbi:hypothetical protein [Caenispirillum salinarum]|nr:hypothetical protein [Caenispirillum salinarum]
MADPRSRSRAENLTEFRRLKRMYESLPPEKRKAQEPHMRKRMQELSDALAQQSGGGGGVVDMVSKGLLWLALMLAVLGIGFFGIMTLARM